MTDPAKSATYRVLLVGVDAYPSHPLAGCVNDIDAIQRILLSDRMRVTPDRIRRLASPHRLAARTTEVAEQPATLDNLRAALRELASERVQSNHRVFIYFAGHGTRVPCATAGGLFHQEALVPVDFDPSATDLRVLYDFELNELLRAIVLRTRQVSLVLDCCHAAGATRDALDPDDWKSRCIDLSGRSAAPVLRGDIARGAGTTPTAGLGSVEDCHVVSACLAHERAQEGRGSDGTWRGLLTQALVSALDAATEAELPTMTWGRIWHAVRASVQSRNASQNPSMIGHPARAVFGGPPTEGDAGIPVFRGEDGYRIAAGNLSRVTRGAMVAVYGDRPAYFPRLDSGEDRAHRIGVLQVTSARRDEASATPMGPAFELPLGARGRVIQPGEAARLRCAVLPRRQRIESQLAASPLLELVADPMGPEVRLEQRDGQWFVTDSVHGVGSDRPVLFALQPAELDCARDVLEHYYLYSQPLRMAELASDLPGQLDLRVLSCGEQPMSADDAQVAALPEAPSLAERSYTVPSGSRVCFQVRNDSPRRLRVTLLNSAASGKVQLLGDEIIDAGRAHLFWAGSAFGMPFVMTPPRGATRCIDRLVAIGRTAIAHDLSYLRVNRTFAEVIQRSRSAGRGMDDGSQDDRSRPEEWTAVQALVETSAQVSNRLPHGGLISSEDQPPANFHALLIGVDDYPVQPLAGCVNDIDAVQRLLLESGLGIKPAAIRRLVSPRAGTRREITVDEDPADFAHIRTALAELASDKVKDTHRVFIYYAGHGKQVPVVASNGYTFQREALVPVDFLRKNGQYEWLYDYEINEALRKITDRTRQVTLILDCCHAAGSFREGDPPGSATRSLDQIELAPVPDPGAARGPATDEPATRGEENDAAWLGRGIAACHIVSACLEHESARETTQDNLRHGLLTRAFTTALGGITVPERSTLPWGRIWSAMRADVMRSNPYQTPRMEGNARRLVFAGPPVSGDPGIPVERGPAVGVYRIEAGTMAEITKGTELAIYGPEPSYFPELGSDDDLRARLGVVRVTDARLDGADATAVNAAFDIPSDARGRVVKPGGLLRCSVRPPHPEIASGVEGSQLIELVGPDEPAPVRLEQHGDRWLLIDDQHGNGDDAPILFALGPEDLDCARAVLEHYHAYSLPMRMATRSATEGLPNALELRLLSCPGEIAPADAQTAKLDDVLIDQGIYQVRERAPVCVYVRNRSKVRLSVTVFDASASGEVQQLGNTGIEPGQFHVFWAQGVLGKPFKMTLDTDEPRARDRLVAIGRTANASTLDYLRNDKTFAQVVAECRAKHGRGMDDGSGTAASREILAGNTAATVERWTAAQAVIEISARTS